MTMLWSEAKKQVFQLDGNMVVSAGAGSGKTAVLVELYIRLLAGETAIGRPLGVAEIMAITFTEKAATEMRERVRQGIRRRIAAGDPGVGLRQALRELPNATIATFHAMCAGILREHPAEAGIDPSFSLLDELAASEELHAALDELLETELQQRSETIRLLLKAFPLSSVGRSRGLRDHLVVLHQQIAGCGIDQAGMLRLAAERDGEAHALFARRRGELTDLVAAAEAVLAGGGKEAAYHGHLQQLVAQFRAGELAIDQAATAQLLAAMKSSLVGNWGKAKPLKDDFVRCLNDLELAVAQIAGAPLVRALLELAGKLALAYQQRKDSRGALDFEDLQLKCRALLQNDADLRSEYRQRHVVLLVDEFQDTNPLQHELVRLLCGEEQRLFLVGDPKQSIYLFRGADVAVFGQARDEIVASGGKSCYFQESFRSRQGVIAFVNALFSQVMQGGDLPFELDYAPGDHLEAVRNDYDGTPCVEMLGITGGEGSAEKRDLEATAIASRIRELVSGEDQVEVFDLVQEGPAEPGSPPQFRPRRPRYGDIAILLRRFTHLKSFERELRRQGIPYYVVKGKGFYRCQEVLDILSLLRYLEYDRDLVSLAGLLRSPICGVSDETLFLLSRHDRGVGAWQELLSQPGSKDSDVTVWPRIDAGDQQRLVALAGLINSLRPLRDRLTLPELLEEIITRTDFASSLLTTFQGEQKVANLRKLVELARSFASRGEGALRPFVNYLARLVEAEPTEAEALIAAEGEDVVRLMTVHQSKGLEFPLVFVPELGGGQRHDTTPVLLDSHYGVAVKIPKPAAGWLSTLAHAAIVENQQRKSVAELKRLFYVAVTRARDYLILSGTGKGVWHQWLDEFLAGSERGLVRVNNAQRLYSAVATPPDAASGERLREEWLRPEQLEIGLQRALFFQPPLPSTMEFSPTALEDYAHCPRKYFYKGVMGLDEGIFAELLGPLSVTQKSRSKDRSLSPLARGDLAHAMLEQIDFNTDTDAGAELCRRVARQQGFDPDDQGVAEVQAQVLGLLSSPLVEELAGRELQREFPFLLRLQGEADYYIRGAIDLVAFAAGQATIYDYKYAHGATAELEGYRFQLQTYQLALSKGWPELAVSGILLFLRDGLRVEVDCVVADFEKELLQIMDAIRARSTEADFAQRQGCDGSHCPFRSRCRLKK